jgi:hypothetical protein
MLILKSSKRVLLEYKFLSQLFFKKGTVNFYFLCMFLKNKNRIPMRNHGNFNNNNLMRLGILKGTLPSTSTSPSQMLPVTAKAASSQKTSCKNRIVGWNTAKLLARLGYLQFGSTLGRAPSFRGTLR